MKKLLILASFFLVTACAVSPGSVKVSLEAAEFKYNPAALEVSAGQPVELTFNNVGALEHDFTIQEIPLEGEVSASGGMDMPSHEMGGMTTAPHLHIAAAAGQTSTLKFTPTKPGEYEFSCSVPGHKEAGMIGKLVVRLP